MSTFKEDVGLKMRKNVVAVVSQRWTEDDVSAVCGTDITIGVTSDNCVGIKEEMCEHTKSRTHCGVLSQFGYPLTNISKTTPICPF